MHTHRSHHQIPTLRPPRQALIPRHFDFAAKIATAYLLLSILWILGSDRAVDLLLPESDFAAWAQSAKGLVFVTISAFVLYLAVHLYIKRLATANENLQAAWDESLLGWAMAMDAREPDMAEHSQNVASLTVLLAKSMGVDAKDLPIIYRGALLHDIGKIGIPDAVLQFPGPLDEEQWALMRQHPDIAMHILEPIEFLKDAMDIPYCHHERWDGAGYPQGLSGTDIPLWA
ncbi:MAG: HD domain-containing phosphohydrolase, partial [Actinomycetota bacterium]|nr:HD domain-containing phosphohydrolase [Actinomycetota bacterium]